MTDQFNPQETELFPKFLLKGTVATKIQMKGSGDKGDSKTGNQSWSLHKNPKGLWSMSIGNVFGNGLKAHGGTQGWTPKSFKKLPYGSLWWSAPSSHLEPGLETSHKKESRDRFPQQNKKRSLLVWLVL